MPSLNETFGMVYAESLIHGTPILYSSNTGFDGMFKNVGVAVNPHSVNSIVNGIDDILKNNKLYRNTINDLNMKNAFDIFNIDSARDNYLKALEKNI